MDNNNFTSQSVKKETVSEKETSNDKDALNPVQPLGTKETSSGKIPGYEEFTYQPKPRFNFKRISKVFSVVGTFLIILLPLAYVIWKNVSNKNVDTKKRGEIIWWDLGGNEIVLQKMIDEYTQKNPDVRITLEVQSEVDYGERLINSLKDGKGPDVFTIHNSWVPMMISYLDFIPSSVYGEDDYSKDFYPVVTKDFKTSVGIVAIPLEYDALTLYVNDDIFARSGKVYPRTWDQFTSLAESLTTKGEKDVILQSGASLGMTENVDYWQDIVALFMLQNKSDLFSPESFESLSLGALQSFTNFYVVSKTWNSTLPKSTIAFAEGKSAMYIAPIREINNIREINPDLNFRTIIIPQVRKDDPGELDITYATYWAQAVWKNSNSKDLAWDFLKYLSADDSYRKMADYSKDLGVQIPASARTSMREELTNDRYLGSAVALAPIATSWYLDDKTNDGPKGINTVVGEAYKVTIDKISSTRPNDNQTKLLKPLSAELRKALSSFAVTH